MNEFADRGRLVGHCHANSHPRKRLFLKICEIALGGTFEIRCTETCMSQLSDASIRAAGNARGLEGTLGHRSWPVLEQDDAGVMIEIQRLLTERALGDPYAVDGKFAANIAALPPGLRAMAATHWLDISLTLDSLTWHFGNFGEPQFVAETHAGLQELGLHDLASCFADAKELMMPILAGRTERDGDPYQILERTGLKARGDDLDRRAWALDALGPERSVIYEAWIRYARQHPERVFDELSKADK